MAAAATVQDTAAANVRAEIDSLQLNLEQLAARVRWLEKVIDTRSTPLWKRIVFRLDGWPSWPVVAARPRWRPWRKWWRS